MKPQAMGSQEFFLALCRELGLSPTDTDETEILWAIYALKIDARQVEREAAEKEIAEDLDDPRNFNADEFPGFG